MIISSTIKNPEHVNDAPRSTQKAQETIDSIEPTIPVITPQVKHTQSRKVMPFSANPACLSDQYSDMLSHLGLMQISRKAEKTDDDLKDKKDSESPSVPLRTTPEPSLFS